MATQITRRQSHHRHRRGARHRPRDRAAVRRAKAPRSWSTIPASPPTAPAPSAAPAEEVVEEIKKRGGTAVANFETRRRSDSRQQDRQEGDRHLRQARRRGQQCRHPARRDLPPHEHRRLRAGHQGASDGLVLRLARRGAAVPRAGERLLRALHLDLGPDRQFRPGQLRRRQARHRRPVEVDRARHAALQRALELRVAVRLEPPDRHHSDRDRGREGARRADAADGPGKDRAAVGVSCSATPPRTSPGRSSRCG